MTCPFKSFFGTALSPHGHVIVEKTFENAKNGDEVMPLKTLENGHFDHGSPKTGTCQFSCTGTASKLRLADSLDAVRTHFGQPGPASRGEQALFEEPEGTQQERSPEICPLGYGWKGMDERRGRCPLGFTSGVMAGNPLNCTRCKSLFFDCVVLKCGDLFCRTCAATMQDCILCGADVELPEADPRVNELVEKYVSLRTGRPPLSHEGALDHLRQDAERQAQAVPRAKPCVLEASSNAEPDKQPTAEPDLEAPVSGADNTGLANPPGLSTAAATNAAGMPHTRTGLAERAALSERSDNAALPGADSCAAFMAGSGGLGGRERTGLDLDGAGMVALAVAEAPKTAPCSQSGISAKVLLDKEEEKAGSSHAHSAPCNGASTGQLRDQRLEDGCTSCGQKEPGSSGECKMDNGSNPKSGRGRRSKDKENEGVASQEGCGVEPQRRDPQHCGSDVDREGPRRDTKEAANFLLDTGLRSMMGGNAVAGLARLAHCEEVLLEQLREELPGGEACAPFLSQLGAVCGLQGDCHRQQGDMDGAADDYMRAIQHLQASSQQSDEMAQGLVVSLNKVGDTRYMQGDLTAAREWYEKALQMRRLAYEAAAQAPAEVLLSCTLDLAVSLCKVSDVSKAMGEESSGEKFLAEGRKLLSSREVASLPDGSPLQQKLEGIQTFLFS